MTVTHKVTTNILNFPSTDSPAELACYYTNTTQKLQIIRVADGPNGYFEKIVFPGQRLIFQAFSDALLDVYTHNLGKAVLVDRISCENTAVHNH